MPAALISSHTIPYRIIPYHIIPHHYTTLHYITLQYITLHYTTLHYSTLDYITVHTYSTIRYHTITLPYLTLLSIVTVHSITLQYITLHYSTLHSIPSIALHYITLNRYITSIVVYASLFIPSYLLMDPFISASVHLQMYVHIFSMLLFFWASMYLPTLYKSMTWLMFLSIYYKQERAGMMPCSVLQSPKTKTKHDENKLV